MERCLAARQRGQKPTRKMRQLFHLLRWKLLVVNVPFWTHPGFCLHLSRFAEEGFRARFEFEGLKKNRTRDHPESKRPPLSPALSALPGRGERENIGG